MEINIDGILYLLNEKDFTAEVSSSLEAIGHNIVIPNSISYHSQEFYITKLGCNSFASNHSINSLSLYDDSKLKMICPDAFQNSSISTLKIPASVEDLNEGWCNSTMNLNHISISEKNKRYKVIDNKVIIGKSDLNDDNYDNLIFACRDIINCTVPSYIKHISSYSFKECQRLNSIIFPDNSELLSIGKESFYMSSIAHISIPDQVTKISKSTFALCRNLKKVTFSKSSKLEKIEEGAFLFTSIEEITIPPHVKIIESRAFSRCRKLQSFQFSEGSEIRQFESATFYDSSLQNLYIPPNVDLLKEGWCASLMKLTNIFLSPENENFTYLNEKVILGKTDLTTNNFDVLVRACSDIEEVVVPSYIKQIDSCAFHMCQKLKKIEFDKNSQLVSIGSKTFADSSIDKIVVPCSVEIIGAGAFFGCSKLKRIEFEENSKLDLIDQMALAYCPVDRIVVPSQVKNVQDDAFICCGNLKSIEFLGNPDVKLGKMIDTLKNIELISFPYSTEIFVGELKKASKTDFRLFTCAGTKIKNENK